MAEIATKTKEELNALKEEVETLNKKLNEPTDEELSQISGGVVPPGVGGNGLVLESLVGKYELRL